VPVYNGLTDESHLTQILADFMTMKRRQPLAQTAFAGWAMRATTWGTRPLGGGDGDDASLRAPGAVAVEPVVEGAPLAAATP
jgi:hypothetical protein